MRRFIIFALAIFVCSPAFSATYQNEIDEFFSLFESGKKSEAVDRVYRTNPWVSQSADSVAQVKTQINSLNQLAGKYLGKELIGENNIKDRFVQVTYIALYERQPFRLEFQFYRPKNNWILYSFSLDTSFDDDVKTASRALTVGKKGP